MNQKKAKLIRKALIADGFDETMYKGLKRTYTKYNKGEKTQISKEMKYVISRDRRKLEQDRLEELKRTSIHNDTGVGSTPSDSTDSDSNLENN